MTERTDLRSPFIDFDYNDDVGHSSRIKRAILHMVRIQKVFDQLGQAVLHYKAGEQITQALVPTISSGLSVSDFGGRDAINTTLFFHAMFRSQPATEKEKAIYNDGMRRIFQINGGCQKQEDITESNLALIGIMQFLLVIEELFMIT